MKPKCPNCQRNTHVIRNRVDQIQGDWLCTECGIGFNT